MKRKYNYDFSSIHSLVYEYIIRDMIIYYNALIATEATAIDSLYKAAT